MRSIIYHYHLFKNAGTSFDDTLISNFPDSLWVTKEFPSDKSENYSQQVDWVNEMKDAVCFSSHSANFPVVSISGVDVLPVIFMRHPIDRIVSAYSFEQKQGGESFGSTLARNTDLKGYIEVRWAIKNDRQCKNFHVDKFSKMFPRSEGSEIVRAKRAVDSLPFVGDVGFYSESLDRLSVLLNDRGFSGIELRNVEKNVSRASKSIEEKMDDLRKVVGDEFYLKLVEENSLDLELYEYMQKRCGYIS
ncbi:MAG: sulfotransferase family 2 domain-containing protein [Oceanospirillaceae bacterium]|nr:sulfotransferase family 2 domain-containing protein [Oceanospirillaceae bacterium]MCP5334538.1 sulfotransferase family 2 domain-containing protein [Oceanospirillaceae bacterium]